jgi:flagellar protein FlaG
MPATAASHLIFFIAAIFIAISLVAAFVVVTDNLKDALESRSRTEQTSIRSRVEIVNDLVSMPYNNTSKTLDLYVKNVGTERLDPNETLVLIDGVDHNYTWRIVGGYQNWTQGLTAVLTVEDCYFSADTDHAAKVSCSNGAADSKEFRIGTLP